MGATTRASARSVRRKEDLRFLTGTGQYTDDIDRPGQTYAVLPALAARARADHAASTRAAAEAAPGVLAVFTGDDLKAAGWGGLTCGWLIKRRDGYADEEPAAPGARAGQGALRRRPRRAGGRRDATTRRKDAAELIEVDYEVLPAVVDRATRRDRAQPQVHDEIAAQHVLRLGARRQGGGRRRRSPRPRTSPSSTSSTTAWCRTRSSRAPRSASTTAADDGYTLYITSQNPHVERLLMSAFVLGCPSTSCA